MALEVKNPPASAGDIRDTGSILRSERSPGGRHDNPLQHFCLENPTERGYRVAKSRTRLKRLNTHARGKKQMTTHFTFYQVLPVQLQDKVARENTGHSVAFDFQRQ